MLWYGLDVNEFFVVLHGLESTHPNKLQRWDH